MNTKKHIVILGAGFAGLKIARQLNNHPAYNITLVDKNNYHQFQPLFYQVALASLDASNISFPLRHIFEKTTNVTVRVSTVIRINPDKNSIETNRGNIDYDYLVIATGATTNFFGNQSIQEHAFGMKSTWEALQIRSTLLEHLENAAARSDKNANLSVVIVGGGPTGVELSGALAEMKRDSLVNEYPQLDLAKMKVYLIEGSDRLLGSMSEISSVKAKEYIKTFGVTIKLNTFVKNYDGKTLELKDGTFIESNLVIWAAGVKGNLPDGIPGELISKTGQVKTDAFNRVSENIFALGDVALMESEEHPLGFPQLASVAIDQANNLASNFERLAQNKTMLSYKYINKGSMATVGRNKAVVDLNKPKLSFQGFFAWIIWMTLHLFLLIGFKNKVIVFINWVYKYFTHHQSLALLFEPISRKKKV